MASDLKWRAGFGWGTMAILGLIATLAALSSGLLRWLAFGAAMLASLFAVYQYRKGNANGSPKVHYRAMLLFASLAGSETQQAKAEGRPFDQRATCRNLAIKMCGPDRAANDDAMIQEL